MNFYRETIKNAPSVILIPEELRNRNVEIIILPLDEPAENGDVIETDANGYPIDFFEKTFGSIPDFPDRELQPVQSEREEIE